MSQPTPSSYTDDLTMRIYADLQKTHQDVLKSSYDRTSEILAATERYELAEEARNQRNTEYILNTVNSNGSSNLAATEKYGSTNLSATQTAESRISSQAERLANENMLQFSGIKDRVSDYFYNTSKDFCHLGDEVQGTKYALSRQAGDYFAKSQVDLVKVENSLGRQADHNFASVQKQISDVGCRIELQGANNTAAIQIEALKNKGDIMQKLAECCCEVKEKISASSDSIKDLVKSYDTDRLRDALQISEAKNAYFQYSRPPCGPPHYPPFPFPPGQQ